MPKCILVVSNVILFFILDGREQRKEAVPWLLQLLRGPGVGRQSSAESVPSHFKSNSPAWQSHCERKWEITRTVARTAGKVMANHKNHSVRYVIRLCSRGFWSIKGDTIPSLSLLLLPLPIIHLPVAVPLPRLNPSTITEWPVMANKIKYPCYPDLKQYRFFNNKQQ